MRANSSAMHTTRVNHSHDPVAIAMAARTARIKRVMACLLAAPDPGSRLRRGSSLFEQGHFDDHAPLRVAAQDLADARLPLDRTQDRVMIRERFQPRL